jgi:tetratricopeptide (TPR) repeat protein
MTTQLDVFISSKMVELKAERDALYALLPTLDYGDIKLHAWVFEEDAPAANQSIRDVYLKALQNSALYLGLFWNQYGEYTIDEFDSATEWGMERHIYVKDVDAAQRDSRLTDFLNKHGNVQTGITAKWFKTTDELVEAVKKSIETWITERLRTRPGGTSAIFAQDPDDLIDRPRKLIGRDDLLREVTGLLDNGESVLLQGFGGMGKTALAATAAGEWIAAGKGAVLWLKCGSASADALFEALARSFNAQQVIAGQRDEAKIGAVRQLLRGSGAKLLVLDDCWNGQALFTVMKAVPSDLPLLVTARQRYALDKIRNVGELARSDSLRLLSYHADTDFSSSADADTLCDTLGDHAFAIEIAGKTLKARNWTPAELLKEIKDAPHDMKTPADFSQKERTSVKDLLDASLNVLDEESRAVFLAFGAFFAPGLTAEMLMRYFMGRPEVSDEMLAAARALPDLPPDLSDDDLRGLFQQMLSQNINSQPVQNNLTILQDHGLVERFPATTDSVEYYVVHDLAYSYAGAQATVEQKHETLDACLAYTERYNEPSLPNFAALRPELDNLLGAAGWAFQIGRFVESEQFAWSLYTAGSEFLDYGGFYGQAIAILKQAGQAAHQRSAYREEAAHLGSLGLAYKNLGDYPRAIDYHQQALTISRQIGDKRGEGNRLGNLGNAYFSQGDYARAIDFHTKALAIARQIGDKRGEGNRLGNLGNAYSNLGDYPRAIDYHTQALAISRQIGDKRGEGQDLGNLGNAYSNLGDYPRAIDYHQQALTISRQIGDKRGEGSALGNLGTAYFSQGDYPRAIEFYEAAKTIFAAIGVQHFVEIVDRNIALARAKMTGGAAGDAGGEE